MHFSEKNPKPPQTKTQTKANKLTNFDLWAECCLSQLHYTGCGVSSPVNPSLQQLSPPKCKPKLIFLKHLHENCSHLGTASRRTQLYVQPEAGHSGSDVSWTVPHLPHPQRQRCGVVSPAGRWYHPHFSSSSLLLGLFLFLCFLSTLQDSPPKP